jgi:hypothetical protein
MAASNSPYSTAIASGAIDFDFESSLSPSQQMQKYKTEELNATAPNVLPYEFGEIPQNIAAIIDNAFDASSKLENILKIKKYQNSSDLLKLKENLEQIVMHFTRKSDKILSKYTTGLTDDKN